MIVLPVFFIFALYQPVFFKYLIFVFILILTFLIFFQQHFIKEQSQLDLTKEEFREQANLLEAEILKEKQLIQAFRQKIENYSQLKDLTERILKSIAEQDYKKNPKSFEA